MKNPYLACWERGICPGTGRLEALVWKHISIVLWNAGPTVFPRLTVRNAFTLYPRERNAKSTVMFLGLNRAIWLAKGPCAFQHFITIFWNFVFPSFWILSAKINISQQIPPWALPAVTNFPWCISLIALQTVNTIDSLTTRNKRGGNKAQWKDNGSLDFCKHVCGCCRFCSSMS